MQLTFLFVLLFIEYKIGITIASVFLCIAIVSERLVFLNFRIYLCLLSNDRFNAAYWWKKNLSAEHWKFIIDNLVEKRYIQSVFEIVWNFVSIENEHQKKGRLAHEMFLAWIKLRKYQILPDDLILGYRYMQPPNHFLIRFACNFQVISCLIELAQNSDPYKALLNDFLKKLQKTLETYIQRPSAISSDQFSEPNFEMNLEDFLTTQATKIGEEETRNKLIYCYGLFYLAKGIAKNL